MASTEAEPSQQAGRVRSAGDRGLQSFREG